MKLTLSISRLPKDSPQRPYELLAVEKMASAIDKLPGFSRGAIHKKRKKYLIHVSVDVDALKPGR
jgi:hypothetical protein